MPKIQVKLGAGVYTYWCDNEDIAVGDTVMIPPPYFKEAGGEWERAVVKKIGSDYNGELKTVHCPIKEKEEIQMEKKMT